jgi:hypothetical protein
MTVSADLTNVGLNVCAWMSVESFWASEIVFFPHQYTYIGEGCTWLIHANMKFANARLP